MPLIGLSQNMIDDLDFRLSDDKNVNNSAYQHENTENEKKKSKFSLGRTVAFGTSDHIDNSDNKTEDLAKKLQKINSYFEKDNIYSLFDQIVNNKEIKEIQGTILKE